MVEATPNKYEFEPTKHRVDAARLSEINFLDLAVWCGAKINFATYTFELPLDGEYVSDFEDVVLGDWIVKSHNGEFKVVKDEEFQKRYDIVYSIEEGL